MDARTVIDSIDQIYSRYPISHNLQRHMRTVAAVAQYVCGHWTGARIDGEIVVATALIHDIGNLVKFDFSRIDICSEDIRSNLSWWVDQRDALRARYGVDDTAVTVVWAKQIGVESRIIGMLERTSFTCLPRMIADADLELCALKYADLRVGPHGVVTLDGRFLDAFERYKDRPEFDAGALAQGKESAHALENMVLSNTSLAPDDISDGRIRGCPCHVCEGLLKCQ